MSEYNNYMEKAEDEKKVPELICEGIYKSYKGKQVLEDINLTIEPGKIYGLIGRNGAGKTTLLSIISAQTKATKGKVSLGDEEVWENEKALLHICFSREILASNSSNLGNYKVKDYLKTASIYYPNWDKEMAKELIEKFELDVKQRINKLSKGMLSMITIIVALSSKAEYTFLDEPVAGLDVVARDLFYKLLLDEYTETGRTFIVSTHIIDEASDVFEEVIMVNDKKLLLKEETIELIERCVHISGKAEAVDNAIKGKNVYHVENTGRSKGAMVLLNPGEVIEKNPDISIQSMTLQQIFVALCS